VERPLEQANPRTLSQSVIEIIRNAILEGRLKPGTELVEGNLAKEINVSRTPLREALKRLAEEGLVVSIPYRGTYVATLSARQTEEVYSLRGVLEEFAVRRAVPRMTDNDVERVEQIMEEMATAARAGQRKEAIELDMSFHRELCRLADHALLLAAWEQNLYGVLRALNVAVYKPDLMSAVHDHDAIMDAIRARDVDRACASIRKHIDDAAARTLTVLEEQLPGGQPSDTAEPVQA
jgi:DNA-binding GntR family transcriptional regulator